MRDHRQGIWPLCKRFLPPGRVLPGCLTQTSCEVASAPQRALTSVAVGLCGRPRTVLKGQRRAGEAHALLRRNAVAAIDAEHCWNTMPRVASLRPVASPGGSRSGKGNPSMARHPNTGDTVPAAIVGAHWRAVRAVTSVDHRHGVGHASRMPGCGDRDLKERAVLVTDIAGRWDTRAGPDTKRGVVLNTTPRFVPLPAQ
jgi:hypothetical protein